MTDSAHGAGPSGGGGSPAVPALLRHFADLRDRDHGGARSRAGKEEQFAAEVELLGPYARQVLGELNEAALLGTGRIEASGVRASPDGGREAVWSLSWPEQRDAGIDPVTIHATYGAGYHHPHLRGATVGTWPLNVFDDDQARAELPVLRAIAAADLHNLVFERDFRIVPATTRGTPATPGTAG
ncbi:MAG TPA: hypothetical protein VGD68_01205 [Streptosporangiaceae bacterium]